MEESVILKRVSETHYLIRNQHCPSCRAKSLEVTQIPYTIPHFGNSMLFVINCGSCSYRSTDILSLEQRKPSTHKIMVSTAKDLEARVIKSSAAKVLIPKIIASTGGPMAEGYISNVEGVLRRVIGMLEFSRDTQEDNTMRRKAEAHLRKLHRVIEGKESIELVIKDPTGNSAIIPIAAEGQSVPGRHVTGRQR